ncbi:MAG: acetyl-CoA carboxylase biotin carboxylase subunit [Candidatus Delongbacteria bacterium]|nr:acetyl-CoA carboxylase biotin carboxylase subunit [Candidatus Delongbacteria bacterium]
MAIKRILVANRGEIALRVIRTCSELGITSVAVYSTVDRSAPFVRAADYACCIGDAPAAASYLNIERILEVAQQQQADAIHPGYGFLAENAEFARRCAEAGLIFIGPGPETIAAMGAKIEARRRMIAAGVPVVPGTEEEITDADAALEVARDIGFPIMLKAVAGGGGKGMRIVKAAEEFGAALEAARRESSSSFGSDAVYIEKYLEEPHHIEVQVLADTHGNVIHLFERECSIQRRHQKVIEETPSPFIDEALRERICATALQATRGADYVNAGTVEFLVDKHYNYYFLEMNTRLQVEHPVTEWTTGIDLVEQQIRIAEGERLILQQKDIKPQGHSIECRIYAEDTLAGFLPTTGRLTAYHAPAGGWVRLDAAVTAGSEISIYYDPMIAKLSVFGDNRPTAVRRMQRALREYQIDGVDTNIDFCQFVLAHQAFQEGEYSTHFVEEHFNSVEQLELTTAEREVAAVAGIIRKLASEKLQQDHLPEPEAPNHHNSWKWKYRL